MNKVATLPIDERTTMFQEAANRRGVTVQIIEKDFWVCWTLKQLFEMTDFGPHLLFKGGTSLSKVFNVIERFSEDIDLSFNRDFLGFTGAKDPEQAQSKKQAQRQIDELAEVCRELIAAEFAPRLQSHFVTILGEAGWRIEVDAHDPQSMLFTYPSTAAASSSVVPSYIKPVAKMEMGARSDHWPLGEYAVTPYAAEEFPEFFDNPNCRVRALEAERTFWEKATILHAEHHRPHESPAPERVSRHYYDVYKLSKSRISEHALSDLALLERVAKHKSIYFASGLAKYQEARPGSLCLVPTQDRIYALKGDYDQMRDMIFGNVPGFEDITESLRELEYRINGTTPNEQTEE